MHIYTTESGERLPSVTTIIHNVLIHPEPLLLWSNSIGLGKKKYQDVMERTSRKGTCIHEILCSIMRNETDIKVNIPMSDAESIRYALIEAKKFFKEHKMDYTTTKFAEETVMSSSLGYAGTIDWIGNMDDTLTLVDYKTSKKVRDSMLIQLSAYDKLLQVEKGITVERAAIILVHDTGAKCQYVTRDELNKLYTIFTHMLAIFNDMNILKMMESENKP